MRTESGFKTEPGSKQNLVENRTWFKTEPRSKPELGSQIEPGSKQNLILRQNQVGKKTDEDKLVEQAAYF